MGERERSAMRDVCEPNPKPAVDKTRAEKRIARVIRHRYLLSHPYCEVQADGCGGMSSQVHHRKRRSQGGPDTDENYAAVCVECHDRIHANPLWAYENGWLVRSWDVL